MIRGEHMRTITTALRCGLVPLLWLCTVAGCGAEEAERTAVAVDALEWVAGEKLVAPEGTTEADFGVSVAIDGDTAIVGAHSDDQMAENAGAAQVFVRKDGAWIPEQRLVASDAGLTDGFGYAVAISGDMAIVGAPNVDDPVENAGAAYVFLRKDGVWTEVHKLTSPTPEFIGSFGTSVAIAGNVALVGASREDGAGVDSGAVHVFVRDTSAELWGEQKKLLPSDGAGSHFGASIAFASDTAIVGAPREKSATGALAGAAYVFPRAEGAWLLESRLVMEGGEDQDRFGGSVAISGNTAIVGSSGDDDAGEDAGAAYVFGRGETGWSMQQKLVPGEAELHGAFGAATAIAGDITLVGTYLSGPDVMGAGSAYLFVRENDAFVQAKRFLAEDGAANDFFGSAVALSVDAALIGSPGDDNEKGENAGSLYTYGALNASGAGGAGGMGVGGFGGAGAGGNQANPDGSLVMGGCACATAGERGGGASGAIAAVMALGAWIVGRRRGGLNAKGRRGPSFDRAARRG